MGARGLVLKKTPITAFFFMNRYNFFLQLPTKKKSKLEYKFVVSSEEFSFMILMIENYSLRSLCEEESLGFFALNKQQWRPLLPVCSTLSHPLL